MPFSSRTRAGPYEILGLLDKEGMGEVYRARDSRLNRMVALKVLHADVTGDHDERRHRFEQACGKARFRCAKRSTTRCKSPVGSQQHR
jgi:serine/threonine protein kinase